MFPRIKIASALGIKIVQLDQKKIGEKYIKYYYVHRKGIKEISFGIYCPDEENKNEMYIWLSKKSFDKAKLVNAKVNTSPKINDYPLELLNEDGKAIDIKISKIDPEDIERSIEDVFGKRKIKFGVLYKITSLNLCDLATEISIHTRNGVVNIDL
jgi:hypothetical protein